MKDKTGKKKKRKKWPWIVGGAVVLIGGGAIAVSNMAKKTNEMVEKLSADQTADVERRDLKETVAVAGTVESGNVSSITSAIVGTDFSEVKVKVGDRVKKGDIIAVLDSAELKKSLAAAEKSLENTKTKSEIELENAESGYEKAVDTQSTLSGRTARSVTEAQQAYDDAVKKDNEVYNKYLEAYNGRVSCAAALDNTSAQINELNGSINALNEQASAAADTLKTAQDTYEKLIASGISEDSEEAKAAKKAYDDAAAAADTASGALADAKGTYAELSESYTDLTSALTEAFTAEATLQSQLELANAEVTAAAKALVAAKEGKSDSDKELESAVKTGEDNLTTIKIMIDENLTVPQNEIDKLNENISKCVIVSDIDGVVTELNAKAGQTYAGGVIAVIQDDSQFKVTSSVDQYDINKLTDDLPTDIMVNALGKDPYDGKLSFIAPTPTVNVDPTNNSTNLSTNYDIEVSFDKPVDGLRIGMSAKLTINIQEKKDVLTVPAACVTKTADGSTFVEIQNDDGSTDKIDVDTGMETNYFIEINSDKIKEGMKVIFPKQTDSEDEMFF